MAMTAIEADAPPGNLRKEVADSAIRHDLNFGRKWRLWYPEA
jgi:hypothetical protein